MYACDNNGNLIAQTASGKRDNDDDERRHPKKWSYTYDYENRLIKAETRHEHETVVISFKYDPFGRRIEKRVEEIEHGKKNEVKTYTYVYDNEDIILEYKTSAEDGKGRTELTKYVHGPGIDEPLSIQKKGEVYYYHADGLGSIVALTDNRQKVIESYDYDSFGNLKRHGDKVKNAFTYTGREWDKETGLYYYRARYYDPTNGRFISKDPIGFDGGINVYAYTFNNPIRFTDPFGLDSTGCDNIPGFLETPCRLECCAKHDECYDNDKCTASSWYKDEPKGNKCNQDVFDCFKKCGFSKKDDPDKPNYYCAKLHRYINIPGDFPTVDAAAKACKSN